MKSGFPSAVAAIRDRVSPESAVSPRSTIDQLACLPVGERLQDDGRDVRSATGQPGPLVHQLGPAETDKDDRCIARPLDDVFDEVQDGGLGPMGVLQEDDERTSSGERLEELPCCPERLLVGGLTPGEPDRAENSVGDRVGVLLAVERLRKVADLADDFAERPERDPLAIGRAVPLKHRRFFADGTYELSREPRLADAGRAEDREELGGLLLHRPFEAVLQLLELVHPSDERSLELSQVAGRFGSQFEQPPRRPAAGCPERIRIDPLRSHGIAHEPFGLLVEQDLARVGGLLQPGSDVHGVTGDQRSSRRGVGHHVSGVHTGPERDRDLRVALELVSELQERITCLACGSDGAKRVVLVDGRNAEDPDHSAGGRCLRACAMALEHTGHGLDCPGHGTAERLRIVRPAEAEHVGGDDGDRLPSLPRRHDVSRRPRHPVTGQVERRILNEHRALEALQRPAGLEAELLDQDLASLVVDAKRLRLTTRPVEGDHQLCAQALPQRMLGDERLQLGDEVGVAAELELGLDSILRRGRPQLLEPGRLCPRVRDVGAVGERRPTPKTECLAEGHRRLCRLAGPEVRPGLIDDPLEPVRVQLAGLDDEEVAGAPRHEHVRLDQLAQLRDAVLDHLRGRGRGVAFPELVDQAIARDDLVAPEEENRHQLALVDSAHRDESISCADLERAEDSVVHLAFWREITRRLPANGASGQP